MPKPMTRRDKTTNTAPQPIVVPTHPNTVHIGIDVGYGFVKAVILNDEANDQGYPIKSLVMPSVCSRATELKFDEAKIGKKYPGLQFTDEYGDWFIGDLAFDQADESIQIDLRGRTMDESTQGNLFRQRMVRSAIGKLMAEYVNRGDLVNIVLSTGLPVDHMKSGAAALKEALTGRWHICNDLNEFVASIDKVIVMPQPMGTIYANSLTPTGELNPEYVYKTSATADFGTYSFDIAVDDHGVIDSSRSGSAEVGMHVAQEYVQQYINNAYGQVLDIKHVDEVLLNRVLMVYDDEVDLGDVVDAALQPVRQKSLQLMSRKWKKAIDIPVIHLAGAPAPIMYETIKASYPQTRISPNPQITNAMGYLFYALWEANN